MEKKPQTKNLFILLCRVSVCLSFSAISLPCMHCLYVLLLSVLQFEALSCISS